MEVDLWQIYINLQVLLKYREWRVIPEKVDHETFAKIMKTNKHINIVGKNRYGQDSTIVLTNHTSNIANHTKDFDSVISPLNGEIILVSNKVLTNNIREYAAKLHKNISSYMFFNFAIVMPLAPMVPVHRILTDQNEINMILENISKINLPKININDAQIIWLGAKIGDIIEITRLSEATGYSMTYRIVSN